jgi:low affinity Fe/Cu permease
VRDMFRQFSHRMAEVVGSPWMFLTAIGITLGWAATGPFFHYSDTWQLVINTGTSVVTFLMVFLIQNTQNRDTKVMQLKLDELLRAVRDARNHLIDLEAFSDEQLEQLEGEFQHLRKRAERTMPGIGDRKGEGRDSAS